MRSQGFTIVELLVVISIIGIMVLVFTLNLLSSYRGVQLRDAATQIASDLKKARSNSQKISTQISITMPGTNGGATYTVGSSPAVTLANGIMIYCKTNCNPSSGTFAYQAPYGVIMPVGSVFTIRSPYGNVAPLELRLSGVTGKPIIVSAVP
ncbi:prepilin-type N-terminal cleavage/methylation domain-containing protein [Deinococcus sp.]|uniref:prepilin-type N-terminal cleavage/methylation domain-containing protein n=1 Tax=Deinococcus sp. TaxID=47478 RepID=UPI0025C215E8|nr:prepilin-type N-terminal cleavage/methylation domain-containing protein [Deinococcus sp.]